MGVGVDGIVINGMMVKGVTDAKGGGVIVIVINVRTAKGGMDATDDAVAAAVEEAPSGARSVENVAAVATVEVAAVVMAAMVEGAVVMVAMVAVSAAIGRKMTAKIVAP